MKQHRRRGLTIVELLVVIAIIGLLVGLLLPAVQSARESARRTTCGNNIRQVGLASLNYHEAMRALPPVTDPGGYPWMLLILPYMEQGSTATVLRNASSGTAAMQAAAAAPIPALICPSCPVGLMGTAYAAGSNGMRFSKCNYLGNGGPWASYASGCPSKWDPTPTLIGTSRGAIRKRKGLPLDAVADGTSLTFLAGEASARSSTETMVPSTLVTGLRDDNWATQAVRYGYVKINAGASDGFGSSHPGGAMFVMCDGSVRFVSDYISFYARWMASAMNYCQAATYPGSPPTYPPGEAGYVKAQLDIMRHTYYGVFQYLSCRDDLNMIKENF